MKTIAFLLLASSLAAHGAAYRCDHGGKITWQDRPGVGCAESSIDTRTDPEQEARARRQAEANSRAYRQGMAEWERGWIAEERAKINAMEARGRVVEWETEQLRRQARAIEADIGKPRPYYPQPIFYAPLPHRWHH